MSNIDNELNELLLEENSVNENDELFEYDDDYLGSNEFEFEDDETDGEDEIFEDEYNEFSEFSEDEFEFISEIGSVLSSEDEAELALEFAGIRTEAEFEEFLGKLFKKVAKKVKKYGRKALPKVKKFIKGPGRKLLARSLPLIGTAVGTAIAPGIGTKIGGAAGNVFGSLLGGGGAGAPQIPGISDMAGGGDPLTALLGGGAGNPLAALLGGGAASNPLAGLLGSGAANNPLAGLLGGGAASNPLAGLLGGAASNPLAGVLGGSAAGNPLASLLGSGLGGNLLGKFLGGEMESRTLEEAKHDVAKRIIRTIAQGTAAVATGPVSDKSALKQAIKRNIPRALRPALVQVDSGTPVPSAPTNQQGGQWVRQGNNIILIGA